MTKDEQLFANGQRLDTIGYATIARVFNGIEPYVINANIKEADDRAKARKYYRKHTTADLSAYEMHHTQDGFIVPVAKELHKAINHFGGCKLFGLR